MRVSTTNFWRVIGSVHTTSGPSSEASYSWSIFKLCSLGYQYRRQPTVGYTASGEISTCLSGKIVTSLKELVESTVSELMCDVRTTFLFFTTAGLSARACS